MKLFIKFFAVSACLFFSLSGAQAQSDFTLNFWNESNQTLTVWIENIQPSPVALSGGASTSIDIPPSDVVGTKTAYFILWNQNTDRIDEKEFRITITDNGKDSGYINVDFDAKGFKVIDFVDIADGSNDFNWVRPHD